MNDFEGSFHDLPEGPAELPAGDTLARWAPEGAGVPRSIDLTGGGLEPSMVEQVLDLACRRKPYWVRPISLRYSRSQAAGMLSRGE